MAKKKYQHTEHERKNISVSHSNEKKIQEFFFCANNETFDIRHLHRKLTNIYAYAVWIECEAMNWVVMIYVSIIKMNKKIYQHNTRKML